MDCIATSHSFDEEFMSYIDFVNALVKIAQVYPLTEEQAAEIVDIEARFAFVLSKLEGKYKGLSGPFLKKLDDRTAQEEYDPRLVDNEPKA